MKNNTDSERQATMARYYGFFYRSSSRLLWASRVGWLAVACFFLGNLCVGIAADEEQKESPTASASVDIPIIEGQDIVGIRIPHYNENNEMVMLITADVARRTSDRDIEMEQMQIDLYDENRDRFELRMPRSSFDMETRKLTGNDGVRIQRDDFTIVGNNMEFDLATQVGIMRGEVTMTIHQLEKLEP